MLPRLRSVPRVRQHDRSDCGAACLESVARYYGRHVPIARIRQHASTDRGGTNVLGMVEAASRLGFSAKGVRGPLEALPRVPLPAIAHVTDGGGRPHFVVLCAADERRLRVMDPADGRIHRLSREEFASRWSGVLVLLVPGEAFRPGARGAGTVQRFWELARPSGATLLQALLGAVLYTLLGLSSAVYVQKIVDEVIPDASRGLLNLLSLTMLGLIAAQVYIGVVKDLLCLGAGQRIDAELILGYYRHLLRLPQRFFDTMRVGEIVSRVNDAVKIRAFINGTTLGLLVDSLVVCSALVLMSAYSGRLALLVCATLPAYGTLLWLANRVNRRNQRALMERAAELESQLVESLGAARTLKRFSLESFSELRTETRLVRLLRPVYVAGTSGILLGGAAELVARASLVAVLWMGAVLVLRSSMTPGELMSFYALAGYLTGPMTRLVRANQVVQDALIAADRLFEILDLEREPEGGPIPLVRERTGDLVFERVHFRYGAGRPTFEGLDLRIPRGRVSAVVGESGSGKTTLALLLQGLYPLESGTIRIGGHDLRSISTESLRRCIGVVPQEVHLFAGDVLENLVLDDPQPDLPRVLRICDELGITSFVEQLPGGFRGQLGEHGAVLSGGQRQRLAIARALYREPEVLILDEATSSLDPISERFVQRAVRRLREEGRTVVQIAHRLTSVAGADGILVLESGRLAEEGTHPELLRRGGVYARLWREQFPAEQAVGWGAERGAVV
jgi:ATP-binding cassette subfamily B protein